MKRTHSIMFVLPFMLWVVVVLSAFVPSLAHAQSDPTAFQVQRFRPWGDPQGMWQTQSAQALGQWGYTAGLFLNYSNRPLSGANLSQEQIGLINHQVGADVVFGIGFLSWLELYVNVPLTIYQVGEIPNAADLYGNLAGARVDGFYLSDIKLALKFRILNEEKHVVSLAAQIFVGLPTTAPTSIGRKFFNGEDPISAGGFLALSKKISIAQIALNLGYRFNPSTTFSNVTLGHELFYSVGASIEVVKRRLQIIADLFGSLSLEGVSVRTAPFEASLGVRIYPMKTRNLALNLGAAAPLTSGVGAGLIRVLFGLVWSPEAVPDTDGDGLTDDKDRCPKTKGPKENKGCPWPDTDGDGLKDNIDKCPKLPGPQANKGCPWGDKDRDGVKDNVDRCPEKPGPQANQGCPWPDTDGDGITDNIDKCPKRKGPRENKGCPWPDTDGDGVTDNIDKCPQIRGPAINKGCPLAIKKKKKIMITQKIFFDFNKSSIKRISYPVIDAVVNILRKYPNLRIRIEGHTDDVGDAKSNLSLSKRRARSVLQYMLRKKVAKIRMTYQGFGKSRPLVQSKSKEARSKNRRVEFVITQQ